MILGSVYSTLRVKWIQSSNKLTKVEIFSFALAVEKMMEYTKGKGCGDSGDYLSWEEMQWNFHGSAKIEHMEAEEVCTVQPFNFFNTGFEWKPCMHLCENLGGSRVPPMNSLDQLEGVYSFLREREISQYNVWVPFYDEQKEGEWRDFFDHQVINYTPPWDTAEPNGETTENCAVKAAEAAKESVWWDVTCESWESPTCLCESQPSFHLRLRGLCVMSAIDKYYQSQNNFSDFARLQLVGHKKLTIEYNEKSKTWKMSLVGSNVTGLSYANPQYILTWKT